MVYVFLATGFEEIEALTVVDVLRRANQAVQTVGVNGKDVVGSHQICVHCDIEQSEVDFSSLEMLVLPGGMPGTTNLERSSVVQSSIDYCLEHSLWIGAICAAPIILGHRGLLDHKTITCFPGLQDQLGLGNYTAKTVEQDGKLITGNGPAAALPFALKLVESLLDKEKAAEIGKTMQWGAPF